MQLEGRTAFVTGAAQGIGEAVARAFAAEGARVCVVDIDAPRAQALADDLSARGAQALALACDVASAASVDDAVARASARFGAIDILVANAGVTRPAMLERMTDTQWRDVIAVNLGGAFNCLRAVVPGMIERRRGRVINVTSVAGLLGTIGQVNYSAAKAGIVGLTLSAARELARYAITVNAVAPAAATPMTETVRNDPRFRERYLERIPLRRWAEPAEVAPVFVFLASDAASYVTGQVLGADGGMTIR